jgi:adenylate kinase family enzyme
MVGASGSGKSTLGKNLAAHLGVPYTELDAIFHQPDWTPLPDDQFRRRVTALAAGDRWVIDGNYSAVLPLVWARADTVIWLDPPRHIAMRRLIWRTVRRTAGRTELWNGNTERWRSLLTWDPQESLIPWAWHHYPIYRQRYTAAAADPAYSHLTFTRIASRTDMRRLLESIA